jgi:Zn-dependent M28 family amino/carboxypeptidase
MIALPLQPHRGPLPALTADEGALATRLRAHVTAVAAREHNLEAFDELEKVAVYLETSLRTAGYTPGRQEFTVRGRRVRNIDVIIEAADASDPDVIVVGAHYDSVPDAPGANDNGSGVAGVLELARMLADLKERARKRIRLVLFVNEEAPYFKSPEMGSFQYARALKARGERVLGMYCLETLGFYSDAPGSQQYPAPFNLIFPDRGDFVAFVGLFGSRTLTHETIMSFRSHTAFPSIGGIAPGFIPGIDWSDHWSFAQHGFPAVMITDTALFRYPHYHLPSDTPDKIDYERLARVVKGIERVVRAKAER